MRIPVAIGFVFLQSICFSQKNDTLVLRNLADNVLQQGTVYSNLRYLCKQIGARPSGSANAQKAVEATAKMLKDAGADTVYLQPCMVTHWVRGEKEKATISIGSQSKDLHVCALGGSIATPAQGIKAEIIEVRSFDELDQLPKEKVQGKIVFFNYPMRPELVLGGYGDAVRYRAGGATAAAKKGAVACMVRSVTHALDYNPHTGSLRYDTTITKIPALACSTMDAVWLDSIMKNNSAKVFLNIKMNCETLPDAPSFNVIGEIKGSEKPDEILTAGGHLDSWDLAEGAHDDGTGVMQSIEVIRALKASGIRPKRTVRAVMFMNEENGAKGAAKYDAIAIQKNEHHVFAIESDEGGFAAVVLNLDGKPEQAEKMRSWLPLFKPYGVYDMPDGHGGTDIGPLKNTGAMLCGLGPNSQRYFDVHHSPIDVFENVNKRELELGAINMAAIIYLVSEYGL